VDVRKLLQSGKINVDDIIEKLIGVYGCNQQEKLSLAYEEVIRAETRKILEGIKNSNFTNTDFLSNAIAKFSRGKKGPMRSLRDTEEQIEIQIQGDK
jgi:hypothetical protein